MDIMRIASPRNESDKYFTYEQLFFNIQLSVTKQLMRECEGYSNGLCGGFCDTYCDDHFYGYHHSYCDGYGDGYYNGYRHSILRLPMSVM